MKLRSRWGALALGLLTIAVSIGAVPLTADGNSGAPAPPGSGIAPRVADVAVTDTEDKIKPIAPCRIVDTRTGTGVNGQPFVSKQTRTFYVGGTSGFAPQGGKSGGCGIPVGASSITATVTAVGPSLASGYLRAWPNGQTEPNATLLNYANTSTSTGASIPINGTSAYALKVRNYGGQTDVVIDVTGYTVTPLAGMIRNDGSLYQGTVRVTNSGRFDTGQYWVEFDRNIRQCSPMAISYNVNLNARADGYSDGNDHRIRVNLYGTSGGLADSWFYVALTC